VAAWSLSGIHFFRQIGLNVLDAHFVARGRSPVRDIVLVTVDKKSLESIPDLQLFWHPHYAKAIRAVAQGGARVLGLDIAFGVPVKDWLQEHDQMLAQAVTETIPTMPVVCIYVPEMMGKQRDSAFAVPLNIIAAAMELAAFANLTVDPDDFVRVQELYEDPSTHPVARSFALKVAERFLGVEAQFPDGRLTLAGKPVPVQDRAIRINYAGPPGTFPRVSLVDVRDAFDRGDLAQLERWFKGKAVLVGVDTPTEDRRATPFFTLLSGPKWNTAGVEIHANTLRTLLTRQFLVPVQNYWRWLSLLIAASITMAITISMAPATAALWLTAWFGIILLNTHLLFRAGLILSTFELLLACAICHLGAVIFRFFTAEKSSKLYRSAVSLFVSKELAQSLEDEEGIGRTATRKFVTILFSDIRGFTAFCEGKDPRVVVDLLNDYMERMCSIVVAHKGHVNKFIGDGILAVFTDDDEGVVSGDHPERSVRCGIAMAQEPGEFRTGVGIHSGLAVVGNVGSSDKMEYTVLGDTVNLASRLESLNKEHHTSLLMSEATNILMEGRVETVLLGAVNVRGQSRPIEIYTAAALVPKPAGAGAAAVENK
jgi:adenylate cyclase